MTVPNDTQRHLLIGRTGSGKTHAALDHLSHRSYNILPWIVYDFKYDPLINEIQGAHHMDVNEPIPPYPGLYVVHPEPDQQDEIEKQFRQIWAQENTGVYLDEGYMIGNNNREFRTLLTQGRSKHIPIIINSQRPVWLDRFVFSESEFFNIFALQHAKDREKVRDIIPEEHWIHLEKRLPEFHSFYYEVPTNALRHAPPAPERKKILSVFETRLKTIKKTL